MKRPVEICGKVPGAMDAISPGRAWPGVNPDSVGVTQNEVRACSACSGDYEDPDRTAPVEESERDETVAQAVRPEGFASPGAAVGNAENGLTPPDQVGTSSGVSYSFRPEGFSRRAEEP